jgi:crotonobetainyl-CoA:carnitine CoA-transferase CaiB-like acyl-CoA transferase
MTFKPLQNVRVIDLTSVVVGPVCTWRLGQYGADVIKVEAPDGDLMRGLGGASPTGQHSGAYLHFNRNKRNICLDLKKPGAAAVLAALVEKADVIVANMRLDALRRLNLDPEKILRKYPDKIYCLITGYGTDGPYSGQPTYDSVIQGATGMAGLMQLRDGTPSYVPMLICDHVVGEVAAGAIMAALLDRSQSGAGKRIEIPMFETMAAFVLQEHMAQKTFKPPVGPAGDQRLLSPENRPVQTADGWISFTVNTDVQVSAFLKAVGRHDLLDDERFKTVRARAINVREWFKIRGAPLRNRTTAEWITLFRAADIAVMPCHSMDSLIEDPHLTAVGLIATERHPAEGEILSLRSTIRFDDEYPDRGVCARPLGADSLSILSELGFKDNEIATLYDDGDIKSTSLPL